MIWQQPALFFILFVTALLNFQRVLWDKKKIVVKYPFVQKSVLENGGRLVSKIVLYSDQFVSYYYFSV